YVCFGHDTITASVPATAPATPPLTGESTETIPFSERPFETIVAMPGPDVDRSITVFTVDPRLIPFSPSATACTICGVGRLINTTFASDATPAGDEATRAPRAASGFTA